MADEQDRRDSDPEPPSRDPDPPLNPEKREGRHKFVVDNAELREREQSTRRDDLRTNMLRSMVTEALLSRVQSATANDWVRRNSPLNETFRGGIAAAQEEVAKRAKEWCVDYRMSSDYVFVARPPNRHCGSRMKQPTHPRTRLDEQHRAPYLGKTTM
jgi:hypothetical protein